MKRFFLGIGLLIAVAVISYVFFTIGMIVVSIAVAIALVAMLVVWIASFVLRQEGTSVFTRYSTSRDGKETTIIDVEYKEVQRKKTK